MQFSNEQLFKFITSHHNVPLLQFICLILIIFGTIALMGFLWNIATDHVQTRMDMMNIPDPMLYQQTIWKKFSRYLTPTEYAVFGLCFLFVLCGSLSLSVCVLCL